MTSSLSAALARRWPDYRTVWRWHFYAGLFCIPFVLFLSITGSIYLFKPQVEALLDRPYDHLAMSGPVAPPSEQIGAALRAFPGAAFSGYELPPSTDSAGRVLLRNDDQLVRAYIHPQSLQLMHSVPENSRLMKVIFRLHGELLLGNTGSFIVELAASWAILMLVSGLYLWWPRNAKGLGGILYPRLAGGSRLFWRDLHSVVGFWISAMALFLLLTGLPWAKFWGDYFKTVRGFVTTTAMSQEWTNGSTKVAGLADGDLSEHAEHHGQHAGHHHGAMGAVDLSGIDRVVAVVMPLRLAPPVVIAPAGGGSPQWTAKSLADNRPQRVDLVIDSTTGAIVSRTDFQQKPLMDRVVGTGIAAHEGQLFGWVNQLLGLLTAMGLVLLCISALVLWWKRRQEGVLGAPAFVPRPRLAATFFVLLLLFAIYLPMFGLSMLLVLAIEKLVLGRIPKVQRWLGLAPAMAPVEVASQVSV